MAKQTFTAGNVLTAAQMNSLQANDYNWTVDTKTDNYTLVAGDAGKRIVMNAATAKTITVNTSIFTAGDVVWIHNINTGTCTITAGTATVNTAGSLALGQWGGGALYFTSASTAIFFPAGTDYGVATGGSSSTITVSGVSFTMLTFTAGGTLTVTRPGRFDILIVAGGGGGGDMTDNRYYAGGGGAGGVQQYSAYFDANQTVTIGAGGAKGAQGGFSRIGTNGNDETAVGGGYGAANLGVTNPATVGGCGGGGMGIDQIRYYSGQSGHQGGNGGNGGSAAPTGLGAGGGGGGGANGANGGTGGTTVGGNGGAGFDASAFRGEVATTTYYAGGGGGGGASGGTGGSGGGGNRGANGTVNTGGGGGGNTALGTYNSGSGGSGIVLVRFKA